MIVKDVVYITLLTQQSIHIKGGHNKEIIMLNIATFQKGLFKGGEVV